jgi:GxxExxY protein
MAFESRQGYDFQLTSKVIGAAIEVHSNLGPGFEEVIYQRAMELELQAANLSYAREEWIPIHYKDQKLGTRRVDFLVENCVDELKAKAELEDRDFIQAINYLEASGYELGLLINFGASRIQIKRFVKRKDGAVGRRNKRR